MYMTKNLRKVIMKRYHLKSNYFKTNTAESLWSCRTQKIFCGKLYKKKRKKYYNNLKLNEVGDNKTFYRTIKPFLFGKEQF